MPTGQRGSLAVLSGLEVALRAVGAPGDPAGLHAALAVEVIPLPIDLLAPLHSLAIGTVIVGVAVHPRPGVGRAGEHHLLGRRGERCEREVHIAVARHATHLARLRELPKIGRERHVRSADCAPGILCNPSAPGAIVENGACQVFLPPSLVRVNTHFVSRSLNLVAKCFCKLAALSISQAQLAIIFEIVVDGQRQITRFQVRMI